ncbi:MAG: putative Multidrug resistance-associated protein 1, partial [Streblomastix strix]
EKDYEYKQREKEREEKEREEQGNENDRQLLSQNTKRKSASKPKKQNKPKSKKQKNKKITPSFTMYKNWPSKGGIQFSNVCVRYREGLQRVLDHVDIHIKGGSKVGIVGRTGSGKSTILLTLLRLVEAERNPKDEENEQILDNNQQSSSSSQQYKPSYILIDGRDIQRDMGVTTLRSNIATTPQDPTLFEGSLRFNLDPMSKREEKDLWVALQQVGMYDYVKSLPSGLDSNVATDGANLSVGLNTSLIFLSRALLKKCKIILMDEATASVDFETDTKIQKVTRECFQDCTVITVAHRLSTIADADMVVVMDQGRVVECGKPKDLLFKTGSHLQFMALSVGEKHLQQLQQISLEKEHKIIENPYDL